MYKLDCNFSFGITEIFKREVKKIENLKATIRRDKHGYCAVYCEWLSGNLPDKLIRQKEFKELWNACRNANTSIWLQVGPEKSIECNHVQVME